ncbi:MAG: TauD/TfdA family dioxygenase [Proteobacteria bacterium]|nr:TauD/TfdA family dioxygenase [Pseudomonadota bacterium]
MTSVCATALQPKPKLARPYRHIDVHPLTGAMGAELLGVDLRDIDKETFREIRRAFLEFGAIFFRDQSLTRQQQIDFADRFGPLEVHPIVNGMDDHPEVIRMLKPAGESASFGVGWHSDNSFLAEPSLGSVVHAEIIPPFGGDTLFANQYLAYQTLSPGMKRMIDPLVAVHSAMDAYTSPTAQPKFEGKTAITYRRSDAVYSVVEHPVVRMHPETGRKALYVNPMFTKHFKDMTKEESAPLLNFLQAHSVQPQFQCRFRWQPGSVAFWDNRCVMHNALDDYQAYERLLYRVTVKGDRPV